MQSEPGPAGSHEIPLKKILSVSEKALDRKMAATYILGPFRLDAETDTLFRGGEPVSLGQRAVALLRVLVERRGIPVPKHALMEAAWAGLTVEEANLAADRSPASGVWGGAWRRELDRDLAQTRPSVRRPGQHPEARSRHRCAAGPDSSHCPRFLEPHASGQAIHRRSAVSEHEWGPRAGVFRRWHGR